MICNKVLKVVTLMMLLGTISCQPDEEEGVNEGKCPQNVPTFHSRTGNKLDLAKIQGGWKNIYDAHHGEDTDGYRCFSFNLKPNYVPGNDTVYNLLFGIAMPESFSYKTVENDIPVEKKGSQNLYQDQTVLVFNHPTDSSRSAAQTKEEFGLSKEEMKMRIRE